MTELVTFHVNADRAVSRFRAIVFNPYEDRADQRKLSLDSHHQYACQFADSGSMQLTRDPILEFSGVYKYSRLGVDCRSLELLPNGLIGAGAGKAEKAWRVTVNREITSIQLYGEYGVICELSRVEDGSFRGRWNKFDHAPTTLQPQRTFTDPISSAAGPVAYVNHHDQTVVDGDTARWPVGEITGPFRAFYHIAAMSNWKDVVLEQSSVFRAVGIHPECVVLGAASDANWVRELGLSVVEQNPHLTNYETQTISRIAKWAAENPTGAVLYCHTKGVSRARDDVRERWRQLMNEWVVRDWRNLLHQLHDCDAIGFNLMTRPEMQPHFGGNFWIARSSWLRQLPDPWWFRMLQLDAWGSKHQWDRVHAEAWIGSNVGRFKSVGATDMASTPENLLALPFPNGEVRDCRVGRSSGTRLGLIGRLVDAVLRSRILPRRIRRRTKR